MMLKNLGRLLPAFALLAAVGCSSPAPKSPAPEQPAVSSAPSTEPVSPSGAAFPAPTEPGQAQGPAPTQAQGPAPTQAQGPAPAQPQGPTPAEYKAATTEVEKTIKAKPTDFSLRMQAAQFYMTAGDHPAAIPHLQAASKLNPKAVVPWIALGDASSISGKYPAALRAYDAAEKIEPGNPFALRGRGQMLVMQKKFQEARQVLQAGLKLHPEDNEIRTSLGNLWLVLNRPREASAVLEPAVKAAPERADLRFLLADAYERDLHLETALKELREAVRIEPSMVEAWGRIGLYLINLTRYKEAREPLQRAIDLNPGESHYHWALGDSYLLDVSDKGNFERAATLYQKALELNPNNVKALYSYAMGLNRRDQPNDMVQAAGYFERLVKLQPNDMNSFYKLSEIYSRLGKPEKATANRHKFQVLYEKGRKQTKGLYTKASFIDTAVAQLKLARKARELGDLTLAATHYGFALERDPKLAAAAKELADVQAKLAKGAGR